ncbi:MAG: hypothetical protein JJU28_18050 [Cyclobacteriaceae bacterium]|nr:hypothetical protein [Cyclobacteriaceae bacterium]
MDRSVKTPLSNVQSEMLKLFASNIPEEHLVELKKVMAKFLLEKARDKADKIWEEQGYDDQKLTDILNSKG